MSRVVVDIETLAYPLESFDTAQRDYLLRFSETEEERQAALQKLNLSPLTARIIAIGMLNPETNRIRMLFEAPTKTDEHSSDGSVHYLSGNEREILAHFWKDVAHYDQIITFNGRSFDCPFLMLRSAILEITPTRNLLPYRFDHSVHCDLLDQLTFYGSIRKYNLDFYCKAFGIESPKSHGITGLDLGRLYEEKRFQEIAEYCVGDLRATAELFRKWNQYLNLEE
ncbi:MAG TPA: ribonuclease H-like domain-containing protein [Bacteroidota bacterium]|nr:ribonuclease H-like domain-containing protein [Bacteroidota bacterium]